MIRTTQFVLLTVVLLAVTGCLGTSREAVNPDDQFGHRAERQSDDGRRTIAITPPDTSRTYRYFPAFYDEVNVRPGPTDPNSPSAAVEVELLIKGAFPDACSELHSVEQQRTGNLLEITLTMRRQRGAVCASVLRPYRFYLTLDGTYTPGSYRIQLNDGVHTFQIHAPEDR